MNKIYKIVFFMIIFMIIPNVVVAESTTCSYTGIYKTALGSERIDLNIYYDNDTLENSVKIFFGPEGISQDIRLKFDYNKFMKMIEKNSSEAKCPYKLIGYSSNFENAAIILEVYGAKGDVPINKQLQYSMGAWHYYSFGCTNCYDGLGDMVIFDPEEYTTCDGILGTRLVNFINTIFDYVKILVPVALIALGSFDIGRAVFAGNEDEMKKATKTFIRRLIIAVIIMFSPLLVNFIINVVNNATGTGYSGTCGIN